MEQVDTENTPSGAGASVGARLRMARISKGYGLEDLAIATGLSEVENSEDRNSSDGHHVERVEHALS